jgi:hypothetical protein
MGLVSILCPRDLFQSSLKKLTRSPEADDHTPFLLVYIKLKAETKYFLAETSISNGVTVGR